MKVNLEYLLPLLICGTLYTPIFYKIIRLLLGYKSEVKFGIKELRKTIWAFVAISTISVIFLLTLNRINFLEYKKPMKYTQIQQIQLSDFRGYEFFRKDLEGSESFAYIVTTIENEIINDSLHVWSLFHPSKSYVFNRNCFSPELLKHELYHFKITELFTRQIKKDIIENKVYHNEEIESVIKKWSKRERRFQQLYDKETAHSYVLNMQLKYEHRVDSLLNLHEDYQQPQIKLYHANH